MGDRCYMQLTCRRTDQSVFEEIGFGRESDFDDPNFPDCVEMIDLEANYAHASDLPTNVVYMGTHDAGYEYGPEAFACDGETYLEQASDSEGGFVVWFDESGDPDPQSLAQVKTFITHRNKVAAMLRVKVPASATAKKEGQASAETLA